ncbi:HAD family hydrolase [Nonomuraea sp. NN258]|uniref:HAD family hydrolase n=1 Tax=Nonomuraea antri TaxID=2730852 RepID=UPI00156842CA|nr:HAD family hydrolase [Nonomuraea antri]NRQ39722.1 HAD family hydrolase [Nonomuraea antri]
MITAILFDLDGTLFDHRAAADTAITGWVSRHAPAHPRLGEAAALWESLEIPHLAAWHAGECSWQEQRRRRVRALCAELELDVPLGADAAVDTAFADYAELYRQGWVAYPDAAGALAGLAEFRLGVLTNGAQRPQEEKVRAIGLGGLLGPVLTGESLGGHFKPAPACYTGAAAALGLPPEQVLLVGDDVDKDVTGPAAIGMPSVWLDRLGTPPPPGFPRITTLHGLRDVLAADPAHP